MYPRNAASPERIGIGPVVQISDGAVQTSGVSISVRGQGGASGAGAGTTAYDNGIVEYTPTQAETDFTSFVVVAYKTGCIPVSQTIITSASATAGYAGVDWSKVTAPTTTLNLSGTTVKTATDVEADTNELQTDWANGGRLDLILDARASQTSVDDLPTNAELATALGAADDAVLAAIAALNDITVADIIAGVADGSYDLQEMLRVIFAACAGKSSGHESGTPAYRDAADTKNRISATTDANGNRTAVTLDAS